VALAFTTAPAEAKAASQAPPTQRPTPPSLPPADAQPAPAPAPAPAVAPQPAPAPAQPAAPAATAQPAPSPAPAQSTWDDTAAAPAQPTAPTADPAPPPPAAVEWQDSPLADSSDLPSNTADDEGLLRPNDKRFFFQLYTGGSAALLGGIPSYYYGAGGGMNTQLEMAIGGHGKSRPAFGGAFVLKKSFGGYYGNLTIGGRAQWDKALSPKFAVYSSTAVTLGFRLFTYGPFGLFTGGVGYFGGSLEGSWGITTVLAERLSLHFRPVNLELAGPGLGSVVELNWSVMGGIGTVF
jgi:hypothetical protein